MPPPPSSALHVANEYLGVELKGAESIPALSSHRMNAKKFAELYGQWVTDFTLPPLQGRETRPLILNSHNRHEVVVHETASYDPVIVHRSGSLSLAQAFGQHEHDYSNYDYEYWNTSERNIFDIFENVKRHCLYSDSVALELPISAGRLTQDPDPESVRIFLEICAVFAPLVKAGVVYLTPALVDMPEALLPYEDKRLLIDDALQLIGVKDVTTRPYGMNLPEHLDPLGPLDGAYHSAALYYPSEHYTNQLRAERLDAVVGPLLNGLSTAVAQRGTIDPFFDRPDVLVLERLIQRVDSILRGHAPRESYLRGESLLTFFKLFSLPLPTGSLTVADVATLRRDGHFAAFRQGLEAGLLAASTLSFDDYLHPSSGKLVRIRAEVIDMHGQTMTEWRRSKWLREHMADSFNLAVAAAAGAAGSMASTPLIGAATGSGAYLLTTLADWLKTRSQRSNDTVVEYLTIVDSNYTSRRDKTRET
jgi:hypothetical protein